MKKIKIIKILYWITLLIFGYIIFVIMEGSELMKLTSFGVVIVLVEVISRREMREAIIEEKEDIEV